jgi:hypothetical protein
MSFLIAIQFIFLAILPMRIGEMLKKELTTEADAFLDDRINFSKYLLLLCLIFLPLEAFSFSWLIFLKGLSNELSSIIYVCSCTIIMAIAGRATLTIATKEFTLEAKTAMADRMLKYQKPALNYYFLWMMASVVVLTLISFGWTRVGINIALLGLLFLALVIILGGSFRYIVKDNISPQRLNDIN